jgi:hypothetical protein
MAKKKLTKRTAKKRVKSTKTTLPEVVKEIPQPVTPAYVTKEPEPKIYSYQDVTDSYSTKSKRSHDYLVIMALGIAVFIGFLFFCL